MPDLQASWEIDVVATTEDNGGSDDVHATRAVGVNDAREGVEEYLASVKKYPNPPAPNSGQAVANRTQHSAFPGPMEAARRNDRFPEIWAATLVVRSWPSADAVLAEARGS